jgi:hypothetical protein
MLRANKRLKPIAATNLTVADFLRQTAKKGVRVTKIGTARWEARQAAVNYFYEGTQEGSADFNIKNRRGLETNQKLKVARAEGFVRQGASDTEINRLYALLVEFFEKGYKAGTGRRLTKPKPLDTALLEPVVEEK